MSEGARGAQEGKHNRALRGTRAQGKAGTGARHRVPAGCSVGRGALQGAPSDERWPSHGDLHYEKDLGTAASRATTVPATLDWDRRFKGR